MINKIATIRILLLEDNPGDVRLVIELLNEIKDISFNVETADSLSDTINLAFEKKFDIILSDLNVTDTRGIDTFLKLREQIPNLPIIVLTGTSDKEVGTIAVKSGAQDYLLKDDLSSDILGRSIVYALERWGNAAAPAKNRRK